MNGYVGIEQETFNVYAGYETRDSDYDVYTVTGNVQLGAVKLGANFWIEETDKKAKDMTNTGYYVSAGYAASEDLTLAMGYAANTEENNLNNTDTDYSFVNVAAMYTLAKNMDMGIDIKQELESGTRDEETHVFAAAYYYF